MFNSRKVPELEKRESIEEMKGLALVNSERIALTFRAYDNATQISSTKEAEPGQGEVIIHKTIAIEA